MLILIRLSADISKIEEALKLYQNALKLHSQGPQYFEEAEAAYKSLFQSEIFTYLESLSDHQRSELYGLPEDDWIEVEDPLAAVAVAPTAGTDATPSTLPQILYLSYKNHALFLLDQLKYQLPTEGNEVARVLQEPRATKNNSQTLTSSLKLFVEALNRDETDIEVWRFVSRIGESLGSTRIARFCLEAVLDTDEISKDAWPEPLGLQEAFVVERLQELLQRLQDDTDTPHLPITWKSQGNIIQSLRKHLDLLPFLPVVSSSCASKNYSAEPPLAPISRHEIAVPLRNWGSCGKAILLRLQKIAQGLEDPAPGASFFLSLPSGQKSDTTPHGADGASNDLSNNIHEVVTNANAPTALEKPTIQDELGGNARLEGQLPSRYISRHSSSSGTVDGPKKAVTLQESPSTVIEQYGDASADQDVAHQENIQEASVAPITLPTRKRSSEDAELEEAGDTGRSKSKRIKARASVGESNSHREAAMKDLEQYHEGQLYTYDQADQLLFEHAHKLLSAFGVEELGALAQSRTSASTSRCDSEPSNVVFQDLKSVLDSWGGRKSDLLLHGGGFEDPISGATATKNSGLLVFLEQSKPSFEGTAQTAVLDGEGLDALSKNLSDNWKHLDQVATEWIKSLVQPNYLTLDQSLDGRSTYEAFLWPETLKETVVQVLVKQDEKIYRHFFDELNILQQCHHQDSLKERQRLIDFIHAVQNIFELHLDVYGRITNPSSEVDIPTRAAQKERLARWAAIAHHAVNCRPESSSTFPTMDSLSIRFLWASVVFANLNSMASRDLAIMHFEDLKATIRDSGSPVIELQNNAIMPEISTEATDREISRLTTMDFFITIFDAEKSDPVELIESLEPILEISARSHLGQGSSLSQESIISRSSNDLFGEARDRNNDHPEDEIAALHNQQMLQFLAKASLSLRLLLWRRLIDAYSIIEYSPRIMSCNLRCIELIMNYFRSSPYFDMSQEARQVALIRWLRCLDDLLTRTLALASIDARSLDCIDELHLCDSMKALAFLQSVLHIFVTWEDRVRIGSAPLPRQTSSSSTTAHNHAMAKFREMQVKAWSLQYILVKEATTQASQHDSVTNQDLVRFLKLAHRSLGLRSYCKLSNKSFVKLAKHEIMRLDTLEESEIEIAQIILDLYGLKVHPNSWQIFDHGCTLETLERRDAIEMIDRVMLQVNKLNLKDLGKSELKVTMDKMQQVIKIPKNVPAVLFNRRALNHFLRSPINPVDLYRCLLGIGSVNAVRVKNEYSVVAQKGWYFTLGFAALARFRNQKRSSPGGFEDLDLALAFFRHDIELDYEKWETWYRLGQVYDAKIEEETMWTAEKLNNNKDEIQTLQRNAIHCYSMAVAIAERCGYPSFENINKMSELYADFGIRIYASSREPFSMEVFSLDSFKKHFNGERVGMYEDRPFKPLRPYAAWKFASALLRRALVHKPDCWLNHYMLGKCLWKMFKSNDQLRGHNRCIELAPVLDTFKRALETLQERRENRHSEKDPILEPHYKIVAVIHKLVQSGQLNAQQGSSFLSVTPYARKFPLVEDLDGWESYILQVLKALRSADKSNWHHRMVLRSAHTIYDDSSTDPRAALGAKHELTQQIFTKTMAIQIWKPENERAGRHFVYTTRYVEFLLRLLFQLNDRAGVEALARQVRKKPGKFLRHAFLWPHICETYLKLLRGQSSVPENVQDTLFKNISHEAFVINADRLEAWAHLPTSESPLLEILKEAIELKKLNGGLIKANSIEDFIGDTYAYLYQVLVPDLIAKSNEEETRGRMRVNHLMNAEIPVTGTPSPDPGSRTEEAVPARQRIRGVGRREIQKRAEVLTTKPGGQHTLSKVSKGQNEQSNPQTMLQVVIKQDDVGKDTSSVPGSLHDSADDESELSDIEEMPEENEARPMFPNLISVKGDENEEKDESDQVAEGSQLDEGDVDGEESYHTPMEM
ncbi:MAG: hypothetical protein LQ342_000239 [Letrouitia transgressa]|nr:MAG: hypothetical protein LQ342_000239 [Letrouitia transgressa]